MKFASRTALPVPKPRRATRPIPGARMASVAGARSLALAATLAPRAAAALTSGKSFGRKRIEHAVEAMGACIMLAVFLLVALLA